MIKAKRLPWRMRDYVVFKQLHGRYPNIRKPNTFGEKILYRKRHHTNNPYCTMLADKIAVRDYVASKIGDECLVPILATYETVDSFAKDFYQFSGQVLKANHGSGMFYIIPEKPTENDLQTALTLAKGWLTRDYSTKGEFQYKHIQRQLLVEQFLGEPGKLAITYYFHLFKQKNGLYQYVLQVIDKSKKPDVSAYYVNGLSEFHSGTFKAKVDNIQSSLETALEYSKALLADLDYARIDWYIIDNNVYFSEITLTQAAGLSKNLTPELEAIMGKFWDLSLSPFNN